MSGSLLMWMGAAITTFWCVGVYNRLMRTRAKGLDVLNAFEKTVGRYVDLVAHCGTDFDTLPGEWLAITNAVGELDVALQEFRKAPFGHHSIRSLGEHFDALQTVWSDLCVQPIDLAGPAVPDAMRLQWSSYTVNAHALRQEFNQISTTYNESIAQFPARLVVGVMRFDPCEKL